MKRTKKRFRVVGLDLAGVPHRPTGACCLFFPEAETSLVGTDEEIELFVVDRAPDLVVIDAPLHLPPGRTSIEDRNSSHYRPCDLELRRKKIPFFPITLGPMRTLTVRGMKLKQKLESRGFRVLEMYPGGAQDIWGIPRAARNLAGLRKGLAGLGVKGLKKSATSHELDAVTGALVGRLYLRGEAEVYGDFKSGAILMPPGPKKPRRR